MKFPSTKDNPALVIAFVRRAVTICICVVIALVVAYWIGSGKMGYLKIVAGLLVVAVVCVGLQERAWVLIPMGWALVGSCLLIPFHFSFHDLGILLALAAYISFRVLTHKDMRQPIHVLDAIVALLFINTVVDFVRNPAGVMVFGSEMIGGRPYFNVLLAVLAYWVIRRLPDSVKLASWIPYFVLVGTAVLAVLNTIVYVAPSTTPYVYMLYGGVDYSEFARSALAEVQVNRVSGTRDFGYFLILVLCGLYPPKTLFNPLRPRCYLFVLGIVLVLISGFRSTLLAAMVTVAIASWIHEGWRGFVLAALAGGLLLAAVIAGHGRLYQLPMGVQRALSFLPGRWSQEVLTSAEESSESRFQWWQRIIKEDVIKDWWFGDGFGVSEKDFQNINSQTTFFEWFTLTGGFHNGPLTAIRFAGIVGLVLFYIFMITAAIYAGKCVHLCRGTCLEPAAIFLALQLFWIPIEYTFVFGAYDSEMPNHVFLVALLLLVMRMAPRARAAAPVPRPAKLITPVPAVA